MFSEVWFDIYLCSSDRFGSVAEQTAMLNIYYGKRTPLLNVVEGVEHEQHLHTLGDEIMLFIHDQLFLNYPVFEEN